MSEPRPARGGQLPPQLLDLPLLTLDLPLLTLGDRSRVAGSCVALRRVNSVQAVDLTLLATVLALLVLGVAR